MTKFLLKTIPAIVGMVFFLSYGLSGDEGGNSDLERARLKASSGDWADAILLYRDYLNVHVLDKAAQSELKDAEMKLEEQKTGPSKGPSRIRGFNGKRFQVQARALSPALATVELSVLFLDHYDLGIGGFVLGDISDGRNRQFFIGYPRLRVHLGEGARRTFVEAGAPQWTVRYGLSHTDFIGGALGVGSAYIGPGWLTFEYFAGISAGSLTSFDHSTGITSSSGFFSNGSSFYWYPFLGIGLGFAL